MKRTISVLLFFALATTIAAEDPRPGFLGLGMTHHANGDERWLMARIIVPGGPADTAGIRVSDVITSLGGRPVRFRNMAEVMDYLATIRPRQRVEVTILRDGKSAKRVLTAIEMPDEYWERWKATRRIAREQAAAKR